MLREEVMPESDSETVYTFPPDSNTSSGLPARPVTTPALPKPLSGSPGAATAAVLAASAPAEITATHAA